MMAQNSESSARKRGPGKPFRKGISGNPGGRPKSEISITHILRRMVAGKENRKTRAQTIAEKLLDLAKDGDIRAIQYLIDRPGGLPRL